jgi:DNA uptake protein ComE-like DNA-binding protein
MNRHPLKPCLMAMALLLASAAAPAQTPAPASPQASPEAKPKAKAAKPKTAPEANQTDLNPLIKAQTKARSKALKQQKAKVIPESQRLDLNSATKEELAKLPGIGDAYAAKIIAGRPYLSKIHLVTRDIIPYAVYTPIKGRVIARQKPK